jgi:CRP-like cAMP-binding protein
VVVRYVSPGDLFGIAAALGRTTYPATATAVRHSLVLAWPSSVWPDLANAYPQLQGNLFHAVGDRLDQAQQRVVEMATEDAEHRVAHALLRLAAEQPGAASAESGEVDLQLSRRDVAELSGTTFHTVSRILTAWERQGLVWSRREQIVLRDRSRLSALAGDGDRPPRSPS